MSPLRTTSLATAAIAAVCLFPAAGSAEAVTPVRISQGHVDAVDVGYEDGRLGLTVHDESVTPDVERDPAKVVLVAKPGSKIAVPADKAYRFLGRAGATVWVLPEVQNQNLLWPGLSTEELEAGVFKNDSVTVSFGCFTGPDGVSLFTTDAGGQPEILVDSEDDRADDVLLPVGLHKHTNWAFEKAGTYKITVQAKARLASTNKQITSAPAVLTFQVQA